MKPGNSLYGAEVNRYIGLRQENQQGHQALPAPCAGFCTSLLHPSASPRRGGCVCVFSWVPDSIITVAPGRGLPAAALPAGTASAGLCKPKVADGRALR